MPNGEVTTTEIMEILSFVKQNMLTKKDKDDFLTKKDAEGFLTKKDAERFFTKEDGDRFLLRFISLEEQVKNCATKEELYNFKSEILGAVDQLSKNNEVFSTELVAFRGKYERLEYRIETLEEKYG